jgi:hypothetical protein
MAVAFVRVRGDAISVRRALAGVLGADRVQSVHKKDAAGHARPGNAILKLEGTADEIEEAREVALASVSGAGIEVFQRHNVWIPGGPMARPTTEERPMKDLLANLEEAKGGDAESLVKKLADAQGRMVDAIDKAQAVVSAQWDVINSCSEQLTVQLRAPRVDGATVAELFKKYQVDAGDGLSSRLVDLIQDRGGKVYPEPYKPRRSRWALVER